MGVGAIGAFGSISGSVSSVEYKDQPHHAQMRRAMAASGGAWRLAILPPERGESGRAWRDVQGHLADKKTLTLLGPPWDPWHRPAVGS